MKTTPLKTKSAQVIRMLLSLEAGKIGHGIDKQALRDIAKRLLAKLENTK